MKYFYADHVKCYVEDDVRFLVFAEGFDDCPEIYLILSRTKFNEDTSDFGVYIDSSFDLEGYDLIELSKLDKKSLTIRSKRGEEIMIEFPTEQSEEIIAYADKPFA
jgi:hypothetical protein